MKVTVVGSGAAFTKRNFNQSFLVEENGRRLLIDCGRNVPEGLDKLGVDVRSINDIYVSHLHGDHIFGLEWVAFMRYDWGKKPTHWSQGNYAPRIIGDKRLLQELWSESLKGGLQSMEGFESNLETFFQPVPIEPNQHWNWEGWDVQLIQQIHVMAGSTIMWTFGLLFKKDGHKTIYFTTDSQHCSPNQMQVFYKQADVIFQDCELVGVNTKFQEGQSFYEKDGKTFPWPTDAMEIMELIAQGIQEKKWRRYVFGSGVHANYAQLSAYPSANHVQLPLEIRNKMWLSHYQDFLFDNKDFFGNNIDWNKQAKEDGFIGFLVPGQEFEF